MRRKLAAGNWKMNGTRASVSELETLRARHRGAISEILICPPTSLLDRARPFGGGKPITLGAQDCHSAQSGAHTGDVSADMLVDAGAAYVILGHSERRTDHSETDALVRAKAVAAQTAGLRPIICVGEQLDEREAGSTLDIIGGQLAGSIPDEATGDTLVIAYEPVWAIGTGKVPSTDDIGAVHTFMRSQLEQRFGASVARAVRLLYGGSVKPSNAAEIFAVPHVDGALVGGASLKADDFSPIIDALDAS